MELVLVPLDHGGIEPQFASHPPLDVGARERPDTFRDLLAEGFLREFQQEPRVRWFFHHAAGTGAHPHKREVSIVWKFPATIANAGNVFQNSKGAEGILLK